MDWEQSLHFEWQANARVSGEAPHLLRLLSRVPLARDFSQYPLNKDLVQRLLNFHCCERWFHRHHNGSVNSKRTHTPKSICQVLKSPLALDI